MQSTKISKLSTTNENLEEYNKRLEMEESLLHAFQHGLMEDCKEFASQHGLYYELH